MRPELEPEFLINAYAQGYFPMPDEDEINLLWFRPDPRAYFDLVTYQPSRSLRRSIRKFEYTFSIDQAFAEIMQGRAERPDSWINEEFKQAYSRLHQLGFAHSVEVWLEDKIVGGLYGVHIGGLFCAESKFHTQTDASKAAVWCLIESMKESEMKFLEVQFMTEHLRSLGAQEISDEDYQEKLPQIIFEKCELKLSDKFAKHK